MEERKLTAPLPGLSLHIVDSKGLEKDIFSLGEILRVQVRMSDESRFYSFFTLKTTSMKNVIKLFLKQAKTMNLKIQSVNK